MNIVRIIRVQFTEDDVYEGSIADECYENAAIEEVEVESVDEAVDVFRREGLLFAATGTDWAANPDGSSIIDHYAGKREETTAHFDGDWSVEDMEAVMEAVG